MCFVCTYVVFTVYFTICMSGGCLLLTLEYILCNLMPSRTSSLVIHEWIPLMIHVWGIQESVYMTVIFPYAGT